jgi:DNA invertase Pin-like site-specific DNA recombinase
MYAYLAKHSSSEISTEDQKKILQAKAQFRYVFNEEDAQNKTNERLAFNLMLNQLKAGDRVYIYSPHCLVEQDRKDSLLLDVINRLGSIHFRKASVYFVDLEIDTATPIGRLALTNLLASTQYTYDITIPKQVDCCCSKTSPSSSSNSNNNE